MSRYQPRIPTALALGVCQGESWRSLSHHSICYDIMAFARREAPVFNFVLCSSPLTLLLPFPSIATIT